MLRAAHRGVRKHRNLRLSTDKLAEGIRGQLGDLSQLRGIEIGVYRAVREDESALLAVLAVRHLNNEEAGNAVDARLGLQQLQRRTDGVARGMAGAGDNAVGIAALAHQAGIIHIILLHLLLRSFRSHALLRSQLHELVDIFLLIRVIERIDDRRA